jgi:hypothetical protein
LSEVVYQMASLGDKKGLEAVSVMVARVKKFFMDQSRHWWKLKFWRMTRCLRRGGEGLCCR